jgi:hypothetical protein
VGSRPPLHERRVGREGALPADRRERGGDGDRRSRLRVFAARTSTSRTAGP